MSPTPDLSRRESRSRRRSTDRTVSVTGERRRTSEPHYYVSPSPPLPVVEPEAVAAAKAVEVRPEEPRPHSTPLSSSPNAARALARPTVTARRYSTLSRSSSTRPEIIRPEATSSAQAVDLRSETSRRNSLNRSGLSSPAQSQANMGESGYVVVEKRTVEVNALADGEPACTAMLNVLADDRYDLEQSSMLHPNVLMDWSGGEVRGAACSADPSPLLPASVPRAAKTYQAARPYPTRLPSPCRAPLLSPCLWEWVIALLPFIRSHPPPTSQQRLDRCLSLEVIVMLSPRMGRG